MKTIPFLVVAACIVFISSGALAHDDGRHASDPLKSWFESLHDKRGNSCCDTADGEKVADVDWDAQRDADGSVHYRVHLLGKWIKVPDEAVIEEPNRAGPAIVWPVYEDDGNGHHIGVAFIRCFIAGAGA